MTRRAWSDKLFLEPCPLNAKKFLTTDAPGTTPGAPSGGEHDDVLLGRRIGPYLIQERVGSGGMGHVYRALREDAYRQQVALKVIRPGLDGEHILHRFRTERQVLASCPTHTSPDCWTGAPQTTADRTLSWNTLTASRYTITATAIDSATGSGWSWWRRSARR